MRAFLFTLLWMDVDDGIIRLRSLCDADHELTLLSSWTAIRKCQVKDQLEVLYFLGMSIER